MHFKNSSDHILFVLFSFGLLLDINFRSSLNIWSDEHLSQSKANVLAHIQSKDLSLRAHAVIRVE